MRSFPYFELLACFNAQSMNFILLQRDYYCSWDIIQSYSYHMWLLDIRPGLIILYFLVWYSLLRDYNCKSTSYQYTFDLDDSTLAQSAFTLRSRGPHNEDDTTLRVECFRCVIDTFSKARIKLPSPAAVSYTGSLHKHSTCHSSGLWRIWEYINNKSEVSAHGLMIPLV